MGNNNTTDNDDSARRLCDNADEVGGEGEDNGECNENDDMVPHAKKQSACTGDSFSRQGMMPWRV